MKTNWKTKVFRAAIWALDDIGAIAAASTIVFCAWALYHVYNG